MEQTPTAPSPLIGTGSMVSFAIFSNGSQIDSAWQVLSINTYTEAGQIPRAQVCLLDGSPDTGSFPISDADAFAPGSSIEIKLGYGSYTTTVFTGTVATQSLQIALANGPALYINCLAHNPIVCTPDLTADSVLTLSYGVSLRALDVTTCAANTLPPSAPPDFAHIQGSVSFQGSALAVPGKLLQLNSTGNRFSGKAYIRGVKHTVQEGNWLTEVQLGI